MSSELHLYCIQCGEMFFLAKKENEYYYAYQDGELSYKLNKWFKEHTSECVFGVKEVGHDKS